MTRAPLAGRSLAAVNPEVAVQLHRTRNGPITADPVSARSDRRRRSSVVRAQPGSASG